MSIGALDWLQSTIRVDVTGEWGRILHVSVGGSMFTVSRNVFKLYEDHPFFGKLCDDSMRKDSDGCTVIDRDGSMFRHILNFIRSERSAHEALSSTSSHQEAVAGGAGMIPPVVGKLLLPDHFDEWDLLLEEVSFYQLPSLQQAIVNDDRYKMRMWKKSLPGAVYVNWKDSSSSSPPTGSGLGARVLQVSMIPELPFLQVIEQPLPPVAPTKPDAGHSVNRSVIDADGAPSTRPVDTETVQAPTTPQTAPPRSQCVLYQGNHQILNIHELTYYMLNVFDLKVNHWDKTATTTESDGTLVEHHIHFIRNTPMVIQGGGSVTGGM